MVAQMRRKLVGDVRLRERGCGAQDQFHATDSFGHIGCDQRELHIVLAVRILEHDARARLAMRRDHLGITPPQPDIMALKCEIAGGRERAIAAAEHRDPHNVSPEAGERASSRFSMKC